MPSSNQSTPPLVPPPAIPLAPLPASRMLPRSHFSLDDKEFQDPTLENVNPYFSALPLSPRHGVYTPGDASMSPGLSQAGFLRSASGRPRGYSDSSTFSDVSASSTVWGPRPTAGLRNYTLSQHPAGPAGNPKLDNSALQGIWDIYRKEAGDYDAAMIDSWNASIDNLILFAGLFSGIITTFLIESYKALAPPRPGLSHSEGEVHGCRMFGCGPHTIRINTMWFTSLGLSLVSALVAMLAKQWISGYKVELLFSGTGSSEWFHEACRTRQFRFDGMKKWKMAQVIAATPILLHAALLCFCIGLVDFLWTLNRTVAIPVTCLCGLTLFFYVGSTISAVVSPRSPFKTALARLIFSLRGGTQEQDHVQAAGTKMDEQVIEWLISTSRSQEIYQEAMKALLELRKAGPSEARTV